MDRQTLEKFSQPIVDIYTNIETELLMTIGRLLREDKALLDEDHVAWQLSMADKLGILDSHSLEIIQRESGLSNSQINQVLFDVGMEGLSDTERDNEELLKEGAPIVKPQPIQESVPIINILQSYQTQAVTALNLTNQTLLDETKQAYIDIINQAAMKVSVGTATGEQAIRSTINQWTERGLPGLIRRDGKRLGVEGYVRSVIVTTNNNVVNELQDTRMMEWGIDLVEISSHAGNRPGCRPYAGRVFSLREGHPKYPYLYDPSVGRIGDPDSLFGVNCGHVKYSYVEGISTKTFKKPNAKKDQKIYEQSQKQRQIERSIRKAKTREKVLRANGDLAGAEQAKQLIAQRQLAMRNFIKETGRTRRYGREQVYG